MPGLTSATDAKAILVVDDEPAVRRYIGHILQIEGFETVDAADGVDACKAMDEYGARIALVITDIKMPRMDGLALAEAVQARFPDLPMIFMTGYASAAERPPRKYVLLRKPFSSDVLMKPVKQLLELPLREQSAGRT